MRRMLHLLTRIPSISALRIALTYGVASVFIFLLRIGIDRYRHDIVDSDNRPADIGTGFLSSYDFIVVGAGSAGSVMANRLSENPEWNVLLVEAGGDETVLSEVPVLFASLQLSDMDWKFKSQPSGTSCLAMKGEQCNWPRGKVLGGSSVLNAMMYIRGNRRDYDRWAALGNEGWSYDDMLHYFKKSENNRIPELEGSPYHGTKGPITVEYFRYRSPVAEAFVSASEELGLRRVDVNGEKQTGYTYTPGTLRNGLRCSTAKAYLRSATGRVNLHVSMFSHVTKLAMENKKVTGVRFRKNGEDFVVHASKEVILSAGSVQTPQILMLSGIGPVHHLREVGIRPVADLPVGKNLQDHAALGGTAYLIDSNAGFVLPRQLTFDSVRKFLFDQSGSMYALPVCEVMAFVKTPFANRSDDWPDVQLFLASFADNTDGGIFGKRDQSLTDQFYASVFEPHLYRDTYSVMPLLLRPESRGEIKLNSNDPFDPPLIYPNYFSHPRDIEVLREGAKIGYSYSKTLALSRLGARINPIPFPACQHLKFCSNSYWECAIRQYTMTIYHPVGTAKMGPDSDRTAVVDTRLRVRGGIRGLRVVDGSIMPLIVNGNTNAPIIAIGEKAADLVKQEWY